MFITKMILFWDIRCISDDLQHTKSHKNYFLILDDFPSQIKYGLQYRIEAESLTKTPTIRYYRHLFRESPRHWQDQFNSYNCRYATTGGYDYFENENGEQVSIVDIEKAKGKPIVTFSSHPFFDNYYLALGDDLSIQCNEKEIKSLEIFSKLYYELKKINPPFCGISIGADKTKFTYVPKKSKEELDALVMLFRKIYTDIDEPGSFPEICNIFSKYGDLPLAVLARDCIDFFRQCKSFDIRCEQYPFPVPDGAQLHFMSLKDKLTVDDLIKIILYSQYHHSPKTARENDLRKIREAINTSNRDDIIQVVFLHILQHFCQFFETAGNIFNQWYLQKLYYARQQNIKSDAPHLQIEEGRISTEKLHKQRVFDKYVHEFAFDLWKDAGCPIDGAGPYDFEPMAIERLEREINLPTDPRSMHYDHLINKIVFEKII